MFGMSIQKKNTMKQNNIWEKYYVFSPFFLFVFCLFSVFSLFLFQGGWSHYLGVDAANTYVSNIDHNCLNNWHSVIFIAECCLVKEFIGDVFSCTLSGLQIIKLVACLSTVVIAINVSLFLYRFQRIKTAYIFLPVFLWMSFFCIHTAGVIGLDYFFVALLLTVVQIASLRDQVAGKKIWFYIVFVLLVVLAFHLVSLRKNALFVIPIIFLYYFDVIKCGRKLFLACGCCLLSVFLYCMANPVADRLLSKRALHPTYHMMASDMCISALLQGKYEQVRFVPLMSRAKGTIVATTYGPLVFPGDYKNYAEYCAADETAWEQFVGEYLETWKQYPAHMLSAKVLQGIFFYTGNYAPSWLRRLTASCFPAVKVYGKCVWGKRSPDKASLRILAMMPFLALFYFCRRKGGRFCHALGETFTFFALVAVAYLLSFLPVTPMAELRYLVPAMVFAPCLCGGILLDVVEWVIVRRRGRTER